MDELWGRSPRQYLRAAAIGVLASIGLLTPLQNLEAAESSSAVGPAPSAQNNQTQPEEVIVTARRRSEELAKVPGVIAAFSSAQIEQRSITQQTDLQMAVPGLTVRQTESSNYLNYVIRGQTVDAFSGTPTAVVPYINEVQFAPGGLSSFFDLQSLQVLKGPQGTLFGRNATGGAVLVTTARPTDEFAGNVEVSGGNYGYFDLRGMLNVPVIADKLLLRAAVDVVRRDGYQYNFFDGQHPGSVRRNVGRVSLTVKPTENIENTTVAQIEASDGTNSAPVVYSYNKCGQLAPDGRPLNCFAEFLYGPQLDTNIGFPGAWAAYLAAHPGANPGGIAGALQAQQTQYDFWQVNEYSPVEHRGRNWFVTNTTTVDIGDSLQLKNIFGASRAHSTDLAAEVGAPFAILLTHNVNNGPPALDGNANDEVRKSLSDEVQLQGNLFGDDLQYILGGYFQENRDQIFYPATYTEVMPIIPATTDFTHYQQKDRTQALYAHASYDLGGVGPDGLTLNTGVRYTWEEITSEQLALSRFFPAPPLKVSFEKPSWNIGLDYQITDAVMLYIQARGSWRTGGINGIGEPILATADRSGSLFLPETTHDVEVGAKLDGEIAGRSAHLFLAAYNQWVDDIQRAQIVDVLGAPRLFTVNVPSARVRGIELDAGVQATDWLQVGLVGAYTDAEYRRNALVIFGNPYEFGPYADTPEWTGTVYAQIALPVPGSMGKMTFRTDVYGQTEFYISNTAATRTPGTRLPGYGMTNLRLDWTDVLGHKGVGLAMFVRNAFNKAYYTGGFGLGDLLGVNSANVGEPRMWGAQLKYSF